MCRLKNSLYVFFLLCFWSGPTSGTDAAESTELNKLKSDYIKRYAWPKRDRHFNDPLFVRPAAQSKDKASESKPSTNSTLTPSPQEPAQSSNPEVTPPPAILAPPKGGS